MTLIRALDCPRFSPAKLRERARAKVYALLNALLDAAYATLCTVPATVVLQDPRIALYTFASAFLSSLAVHLKKYKRLFEEEVSGDGGEGAQRE